MPVLWIGALPIGALTLVVLLVAIASVGDESAKIVIRTRDVSGWGIACFLLVVAGLFVGVLVVHELVHLLAHPRWGFSRDSVFGVWPKAGLAYAFYDNEMSRNRFLTMIALPFLVLSVVPVALFWITGKVIMWLAFVVLVNGLGSCFDLLVLGIVAVQVPSAAVIRNQGWETYWQATGGPARADGSVRPP